MQIISLDHVEIATQDLTYSVRFYSELIGLEPRDPPKPLKPEDTIWMYDQGGREIIHLRRAEAGASGTGRVNHIALNCSGLSGLLETLKEQNIEHRLIEVPGTYPDLIFLHGPSGEELELRFAKS